MQEETWGLLQRELEAEVAARGWGPAPASRVDRFLTQSSSTSGPYLAAANFKLQQATTAWKAACQEHSRRQGQPGVAASNGSTSTTSSNKLGIEHAITLWMTVQVISLQL